MRRTSSRMIGTNVGDRDTKCIRRKKKNTARADEDAQDAIIPLPASCMFTDAPLDTSLLKITMMSMSTNTKSLILILPHVDADAALVPTGLRTTRDARGEGGVTDLHLPAYSVLAVKGSFLNRRSSKAHILFRVLHRSVTACA